MCSSASHFSIFATTRGGVLVPAEDLAQRVEVGRAAHERQRHVVEPVLDRPGQIAAVLLGQGRHAQRRVGQVHALVARHRAADGDGALDRVGGAIDGQQADQPVVDVDAVPGLDLVHEPLVAGRQLAGGAGCVAADEADHVAGAQQHRAARDLAQPDLRTRQVPQHRDGPAVLVRPATDAGQHLGVLLERAVAEVQPADAHAGFEQLRELLLRPAGRSERGDDAGQRIKISSGRHRLAPGTTCGRNDLIGRPHRIQQRRNTQQPGRSTGVRVSRAGKRAFVPEARGGQSPRRKPVGS